MPGENVKLVRRLFEMYNSRDFEVAADLVDPEFVWDVSRVNLPEGAGYRGLAGMREFVEEWEQGWDADHVEAEEVIDLGERVVTMVHHRGHGRGSGMDIDQRFAMVWTIRGGRAAHMEMYPTRAEAVAAVGYRE